MPPATATRATRMLLTARNGAAPWEVRSGPASTVARHFCRCARSKRFVRAGSAGRHTTRNATGGRDTVARAVGGSMSREGAEREIR